MDTLVRRKLLEFLAKEQQRTGIPVDPDDFITVAVLEKMEKNVSRKRTGKKEESLPEK